MKTRMRPRYYCDHCGKGSGSPSAMRRHESSCTMNPKRSCRMCGKLDAPMGGRLLEGMVAFLMPAIVGDWPARMKALRAAVGNCPCCILAVIRQTGAVTPGVQVDDGPPFPKEMYWTSDATSGRSLLGFDFKAEMAARMQEVNDAFADDPRNCY